MNTVPASVTRASACVPAILNRIRKTIAFLRMLSLNAEKNCVQNRGEKRRPLSNFNMVAPFGEASRESVCVRVKYQARN